MLTAFVERGRELRLASSGQFLRKACTDSMAASSGSGNEIRQPQHGRLRTEYSAREIERVIVWCHRGEVTWEAVKAARDRLPALLPVDLEGEVLAGPLATDGPNADVLVLSARVPRRFRGEDAELFR